MQESQAVISHQSAEVRRSVQESQAVISHPSLIRVQGGREGGFEAERGGQQPSGQHPLVSTLPSGCRVHELGVADIGTGTSAFDVRSAGAERVVPRRMLGEGCSLQDVGRGLLLTGCWVHTMDPCLRYSPRTHEL